MSQMLHIIRKDLRHLRLPLALWAALLVCRALLTIAASWPVAVERQPTFAALSPLMAFLELVLQAFVIARLVHDEPAVGLNAFWVTRPYRRGALVAAKLTLATIALVAVPAVRDVIVFGVFGAAPGDMARAAATTAAIAAWYALAFAVIAALTPSFTYFVMTIVGLLVALVGFVFVSAASRAVLGTTVAPTPPGYLADATSPLLATILFILGAIVVVRYQYRRRSWWRAAAVAGVSLVVSHVVADRWPWRFARQSPPVVGEWAAATAVMVPADDLPQATRAPATRGEAQERHVNARVELDALPGQYQVQSIQTRWQWTSRDGPTIRGEQWGRFAGQLRLSEPVTQRNAVGVAMMETEPGPVYSYAIWPALIAVPETDYAALSGRTGRLDAELDLYLRRSRVVAALPLTPGAAWNGSGVHAEIVDVQPPEDGQVVLQLRWWKLDSPLEPRPLDSYDLVLRNRQRSQAVGVDAQPFSGFTRDDIPFGIGFSAATPSRIQLRQLRFPAPWEQPSPPVRVDREWLAGAELVIVEGTYGGRITKRLTAEEFRLP